MNYIKRTVELIWVKATLNLRSEASVNYLSYAWWIIEPLLHMVVYYVVFSFLLSRGGENYVAFLLSGLIPWLWFSKTVSHTMGSIMGGKQLMNQLFISKLFFPLTFIVQDTVKQFIVFFLLVAFLYFYGISPSYLWFYSIAIFVIELLFITGVALLAALVVPYVRDMTFVIPTGLQFLMFCSGIFFDPKSIPSHIQNVFFINPMAILLNAFRDVFLNHQSPNFGHLVYVTLISLGLIALAVFLYRKLEYSLPRVVLD